MKSSPTAAPLTLGLLADRFDEPYQQAILRTIEDAAQQRGANSLAFAGGIVGSTVRGSDKRSLMFELVDRGVVDGVILLAGTMVNQLGLEGLDTLLARLRDLPVCAIAVEVPGVPSIVVDNEAGVNQAMRHLIDHHGARRIGFIRGPLRNKEAEVRHAAYRAAMERVNVPVELDFVYTGDFLRASGERAVDAWLSFGKERLPDAVLCANDEMAIGALRAFVRAGVRVPEDVRVIGFDGVDVARLSNPPLSTVRQPLEDLAVMSVRTLMDQIAGRKVSALQTLETHLVVRESCGCVHQLTSTGQSQLIEEASASRRSGDEAFATAFARFRQPLVVELARVARGEFSSFPDWDGELISGFAEQVTSRGPEFTQRLQQLVRRVQGRGHDISRLQDVITAFRRFALPCCGDDQSQRTHAENVLQEARVIVAHATERAHGERCIELERFALRLGDVTAALTRSHDIHALSEAICQELPRLGLQVCYVCAYEPENPPAESLPSKSRLIGGFDTEIDLSICTPADTEFPSAELLPASLRQGTSTCQMSVLPLFLKERNLGFLVVQARDCKSAVLEAIREHVSIALYGAWLASRDSNS